MEELRKIIRETLEEQMKEQRYVAKMEFYVYADDDEQAKLRATMMAEEMNAKMDNQAKVVELGRQSFGTLGYKPLDL